MRRTKEDAEKTRQAILDAALTVFSEKGFHATRLVDVARLAGATRGAVYHHFRDKADLFRTLTDEGMALGEREVQAAIAEGGSFSEVCRRIFRLSATLLRDDERYRKIAALSLFRTGASPELAEIESKRVDVARETVRGVASFMEHGMADGALRSDLDAESLARAFLALQNGLAWLWLANGQFFDIDRDADALADILWSGIRKR